MLVELSVVEQRYHAVMEVLSAGAPVVENWSHEEYLAAVLQRQVAERESAGTVMRIRTAHFCAVKTLEESTSTTCPRCAATCSRTWPLRRF